MADQIDLFDDVTFVAGFKPITAAMETEFICPACFYEWSGKPKPKDSHSEEQYQCPMCSHAWTGKAKAASNRRPVFGSKVSTSARVVESIEKPPYRVPLMSEIAELPKNGFKMVSTFSGCGGSCTGFKFLGFDVLWASEFIPAARETYRLNHPKTILDARDIRQVTAEDILAATGLKVGELDVFEGSPPCASFSTAGKREAGWNKVKKYSDSKQRTDDLFYEYTRLLKGLQPKVFVAENVSGLTKGTAKGYCVRILDALEKCGYVVEAMVLDAQYLGVPQMRARTIFMGVRSDLGMGPVFPDPLPYTYTVRDALPWLVALDRKYEREFNAELSPERPAPAVLATEEGGSWAGYSAEVLVGKDAEPPKAAVVCHNPTSAFDKEPKRYEGPAPAVMAEGIGAFARHQYYLEVQAGASAAPGPPCRQEYPYTADYKGEPSEPQPAKKPDSEEVQRVFVKGVKDSQGAFRVTDFTDGPCPTILANPATAKHYIIEEELIPIETKPPVEPESDISGYAIGAEYDKIPVGGQSEKYFQLVRPDPEKPCPTITQTAGNTGAAGVCHPTEKRKFSIAELRRICGFPDDFILTGTYSQQWERLGRAVPPVMMAHVARCVLKILTADRDRRAEASSAGATSSSSEIEQEVVADDFHD